VNILIVDDEPGTRLMAAAAVERLGHRAAQAPDGAEAWSRFEAEAPDVVITDWAMPGLTGTELASRIRRSARTGYTYVLVVTGRADAEAQRDAMRAGADDVLSKPLDPAELDRKLIAAERLVTEHRRLHEDARMDPLTGLGSRRRLMEDLAALCARVERYGHNYCVAMVGLGQTDDELLRSAGRALAGAIRSGDVAYRSSPSRFIVLLPEQALDTAQLAAERLRSIVEASLVGLGGSVTVSVGIAFTTSSDCNPEGLIEQAESALQRAMSTPGRGIAATEAGARDVLRLIVADDDPVSRLMLGAIVRREAGLELVAEAEDANQAIELALRRRPDVVLLDADMPGGGGARAAVEIREALPEVRIVAISADDSQGSQYDMMRAGAVGFLTKGSSDDEILRVIRSSARW
jgi:diguanylate cyclase (GGDEF)-like protein